MYIFTYPLLKGLVNGLFSKNPKMILPRQNAKERNIASDLTIGTGGRLINDAIDNFHRDPARKVHLQKTLICLSPIKYSLYRFKLCN